LTNNSDLSECATTIFIPPPLIVERDDGRYQLGLDDDAPGPFESRRFAESVAARFVVSA
jgi:hypothetical protein